MRPVLVLVRGVLAAGGCAGLATAQWSAIETQQVVPEVVLAEQTFGAALDVSDGRAVVGAYLADAAYVFEIDPGTGEWQQTAVLTGSNQFGTAVALSGDTAAVGEGSIGSPIANEVHVFEHDGTGGWRETATLSDPLFVAYNGFGESLGISGDTIVAGEIGGVAIFERDQGGPGAWGLAQLFTDADPGDSSFGRHVAIDGDLVVAGAMLWDVGSEPDAGAAFVFRRAPSGGWSQEAMLVADDAAAGDRFGSAVAISGSTAIVGATGDDHAGGIDAGSVYVFERSSSGWQQVSKYVSAFSADGLKLGGSVDLDFDTAVAGAAEYGEPQYVAVLKRNLGGVGGWGAASEWQVPDGFYGGLSVAGDLLAVDEAFGGTMLGFVHALAYDPIDDVLYGVDAGGYLVTVDRTTAEATPIGPTGFANVQGLAYDPSAGILYATDIAVDQLLRIDATSGVGTAIGPLGFTAVRGLDLDPLTGTLYGTDNNTDRLLTIDVQTGAGTVVGNPGFDNVKGLAFDPGTGTLYGVTDIQPKLIAIDTQTGVGTLVGAMGLYYNFDCGLAVDTSTGTLYGTYAHLVVLDQGTGAGTEIAEIVSTAIGPVHVYEISHASEIYCTAGTSASGCTASIAASGQASAGAASGFVLSAAGVEGAKDGLFFFGSHGKQASPWGNGTSYQCVVPPVKRAGLLRAVGTPGACDGAFAQDLNALWCPSCPKPQAGPGAGAMAQAQLWYRDPSSTSNQPTSLSDAVEFYVAP